MSNTRHNLVAGSAYLVHTVQLSYISIRDTAVERYERMKPRQELVIVVWKLTSSLCCPRIPVKMIGKSNKKQISTYDTILYETIL